MDKKAYIYQLAVVHQFNTYLLRTCYELVGHYGESENATLRKIQCLSQVAPSAFWKTDLASSVLEE